MSEPDIPGGSNRKRGALSSISDEILPPEIMEQMSDHLKKILKRGDKATKSQRKELGDWKKQKIFQMRISEEKAAERRTQIAQVNKNRRSIETPEASVERRTSDRLSHEFSRLRRNNLTQEAVLIINNLLEETDIDHRTLLTQAAIQIISHLENGFRTQATQNLTQIARDLIIQLDQEARRAQWGDLTQQARQIIEQLESHTQDLDTQAHRDTRANALFGNNSIYKKAHLPFDQVFPDRFRLGEMNVECKGCGAKHFPEENSEFGFFQDCCNKGNINRELMGLSEREYPKEIKAWLTEGTDILWIISVTLTIIWQWLL